MGFTLLVLGVAGVVAWAFWYNSEEQTIRRTLRKAPTKRIQDLRDDELGKVGHA